MYTCPNFDIAQSDVFINAGPGCPMRGPGNVPGAFALEQTIDELADKLGMDRVALRDRIDTSPVRREERRIGAERFGWSRRHAPGADSGPIKRGLGMAQSLWGANVQTNSSCEVRILRDGSVEVLSSVQDIGTGIGTVLAQVVAEELGLRVQDITVRIGDTEFPTGPPSYGSMTTASITPAARNAAHKVLQELFALVAPSLETSPEGLRVIGGKISTADNARSMTFREAARQLRTDRISAVASRSDDYGGFARKMGDMASAQNHLGGVQFAQVAVDTETGAVHVERVVAVQDCGRPMNPLQIESQVQGGILQGISYALFEDRILDRHTGHMLNANLEQYKIVGAQETPVIEVHLLENYQGMSSTDAYGIAEPSNIATAPAIANAVYNAIGVRVRRLPMTPGQHPDRARPGAPQEHARMNSFEWTSPRALADATEAGSTTVADAMASQRGRTSTDSVVLKAGGIDLLDLMKEGLLTPRRIVNLRAVPDLDGIARERDGGMRVGANVTLAQLAQDPLIRARYRALADATRTSASPQIRAVATIGGNLLQRPRCWYFRSRYHHCVRKGGASCFAFAGENQYHAIFGHNGCAIVHPSTAATALVAFGAKVELVSTGGASRIVRLDEFLVPPEVDLQRENDLKPGEVLVAIRLPPQAEGVRSAHLKQGEKEAFDWPIADVAAVLEIASDGVCRGASIVLGAAAPTPHRASAAEAALIGQPINDTTARAAGRAALAGAAPLTKNAYKLPIFETLVRRTILAAASQA